MANNCDTVPTRTYQIGIKNTSAWGIEVAFFQLIADDEAVFPPYIKDTGTFSPCNHIPPTTDCIVDPCVKGSPGNPIQGRTAKMSVKFVLGGQTHDDQQTAVAPIHRHWINAIWGYSSVRDAAGKESISVKFAGEHADDGGREAVGTKKK